MNFTFYNYTAEDIRVNKTAYLGTGTVKPGNAYAGDQDVLNPVVYIESDTIPGWNYCYCQEYDRYYFVSAPRWMSSNIWQLTLTADPLMSWRTKIVNQSGVVQYSNQGLRTKYDPRLVYNMAPSYTREDPVSTTKRSAIPYILMRVRYFDDNGLNTINTSTPDLNTRYYIMTPADYMDFSRAYYDLLTGLTPGAPSYHEELAIAIGKTIMDCTLLFYFDSFPQTYRKSAITFNSPEINVIQGGGTAGGYSLNVPCWMYEYDTSFPKVRLSWLLEPDTYWKKKAERNIYIPYVGSLSIDLDRLGMGSATGFFAGVELSYDLASNAYIVTPGVAAIATGADAFDRIFPSSAQRCANMFTAPFLSDASFENADAQATQQLLGIIGTTTGGIISAAATGGATVPATVASLGMGIANMGLNQDRVSYAQASSIVFKGSSNGGSPDIAYIEYVNGSIVYPKAQLETLTTEPAPGYEDFWNRFGLPDGAYRSLSGMTGYVQLADIILTGFHGVSLTEREDIRRALLGGVIM